MPVQEALCIVCIETEVDVWAGHDHVSNGIKGTLDIPACAQNATCERHHGSTLDNGAVHEYQAAVVLKSKSTAIYCN